MSMPCSRGVDYGASSHSHFQAAVERSASSDAQLVSWRVRWGRGRTEISWGNNNNKGRGWRLSPSSKKDPSASDVEAPSRQQTESKHSSVASGRRRQQQQQPGAPSGTPTPAGLKRRKREDVTGQRSGATSAAGCLSVCLCVCDWVSVGCVRVCMRVWQRLREPRDPPFSSLLCPVWAAGWTTSRVACGSTPEPSEGRDPTCRRAGSHAYPAQLVVHKKAIEIHPEDCHIRASAMLHSHCWPYCIGVISLTFLACQCTTRHQSTVTLFAFVCSISQHTFSSHFSLIEKKLSLNIIYIFLSATVQWIKDLISYYTAFM